MPGRLLPRRAKVSQPGSAGLNYMPSAAAFVHGSADVYTGNGAYPVPGPKRLSGIACLVSGSWMAGHRQTVSTTDKHSHVMLIDPNLEIRDPYAGNGQALGNNADAVLISGANPAGTVSPWLFVVFSFVTIVPGLGRKKVVILDQISSYPATILLRDSFSDTNGTALASHIMEVGAGWTVVAGTATIQANQCSMTGVTQAYANAGKGDFSSASLDLIQVKAAGAEAGFTFRWSDSNNYWQARLSTTQLDLRKVVAGAGSVVQSTAVSLTLNSKHTLNLTASGSNVTLNVDGGNQITASDSFNSSATNYGFFGQSGAGALDNFLINQ